MLKNRISICHSETKQVVDRTEAAGRLSPMRHKQSRNPAFLETEPAGMQAQQGMEAGFTVLGQGLGGIILSLCIFGRRRGAGRS